MPIRNCPKMHKNKNKKETKTPECPPSNQRRPAVSDVQLRSSSVSRRKVPKQDVLKDVVESVSSEIFQKVSTVVILVLGCYSDVSRDVGTGMVLEWNLETFLIIAFSIIKALPLGAVVSIVWLGIVHAFIYIYNIRLCKMEDQNEHEICVTFLSVVVCLVGYIAFLWYIYIYRYHI